MIFDSRLMSMLPPETTETTVFPSVEAAGCYQRPAVAAASTTSFSICYDGVGNFITADGDNVIDEFTNDLEVFRRDLHATPSAMTGAHQPVSACRPAGLVTQLASHADDADVGGYRLNVGSDAGNDHHRRPEPDRQRACGFCSAFNPDGTLTGSHQGVIERMDI